MPQRRRVSKVRQLSHRDRCGLTVGGFVEGDEERGRLLWEQFRGELVGSCRAGRRPWAWWRWDVGVLHECRDYLDLAGDGPSRTRLSWVPDDQELWLAERGLLEEDEIAVFVDRLGWEKGPWPAFARRVLDAHERWLEGSERGVG